MSEQETKQYITEDMIINDIVTKYPDAVEILQSYGLHCFGCHVNAYESIGMGARGHGMPEETIKTMINEANEFIRNKEAPTEKEEVKEAPAEEKEAPIAVLTDQGAKKVTDIMKEQKKEGYGLKISVIRGGCAGYTYNMDFEKEPEKDDNVIESKGVKMFIDKKSAEFLKGTSIDYVESLQESGFKIDNPNAKSSCGCGKSVS